MIGNDSDQPIEYWEPQYTMINFQQLKIRATSSTSWRLTRKFETSLRPLRLKVWSQEVAEVDKVFLMNSWKNSGIMSTILASMLTETECSQYSSRILMRITIEFCNRSHKCTFKSFDDIRNVITLSSEIWKLNGNNEQFSVPVTRDQKLSTNKRRLHHIILCIDNRNVQNMHT